MVVRFDVLGVCTGMVDLKARASAQVLQEVGADEGHMKPIDEFERSFVIEELTARRLLASTSAGGSVANTVATLALLGSKTAMGGCVGHDSLGQFYAEECNKYGVSFVDSCPMSGVESTGICIVLLHQDGQRSMLSYLGAAKQVVLTEALRTACCESAIVLVEGYLLNAIYSPDDTLRDVTKCLRVARAAGNLAALSLSDAACVTNNLHRFRSVLAEGVVDVVLGNADEALALTGETSLRAACTALAHQCRMLVAITDGVNGALLVKASAPFNILHAPAELLDSPEADIDTTGAGDAFAAGILHGILHQWPLAASAALGAHLSARVIRSTDARIPATTTIDLSRFRTL